MLVNYFHVMFIVYLYSYKIIITCVLLDNQGLPEKKREKTGLFSSGGVILNTFLCLGHENKGK